MTNKDLAELVRAETFRDDLFYRIRVIHLKIPALKERREDVPLLVDHTVAKFNRLQGKDIAGVSQEVLVRLMDHDYPGNVRELENIIEQAFVMCRDVELQHLPIELRPPAAAPITSGAAISLRSAEEHLIESALKRNRRNRQHTARELGINASTLYRKMKALGLPAPVQDGRGKH